MFSLDLFHFFPLLSVILYLIQNAVWSFRIEWRISDSPMKHVGLCEVSTAFPVLLGGMLPAAPPQ